MTFNINKIATDYVHDRFPEASSGEKKKIIKDWEGKVTASRSLVADFKNRVGNPKGKRVIDVGSGPGGVSIAFAEAGAHVSGVDIEQDLHDISLKHAGFYGVDVNFVLYDGLHLPFEDHSFDYAVSVSVLEHTTNPVLYLSEIYRVLKPGGFLYLGFPNKLWPKETHTQIWFLTYIPTFLRDGVVKILKRNPLKANNLHFYSYFDLQSMLSKMSPRTFSIVMEKGLSSHRLKVAIRAMLGIFHIPYKSVLPHILLILKK
jgi:ubiquinone/menaquinone biosynthesis C-methylase UbiE